MTIASFLSGMCKRLLTTGKPRMSEKELIHAEHCGRIPYRRIDMRIARHLADQCLDAYDGGDPAYDGEYLDFASRSLREYFRRTDREGLDLIRGVYSELCYLFGQDLVHRTGGITDSLNSWYAASVQHPPKTKPWQHRSVKKRNHDAM